jgi:hypothetical protein
MCGRLVPLSPLRCNCAGGTHSARVVGLRLRASRRPDAICNLGTTWLRLRHRQVCGASHSASAALGSVGLGSATTLARRIRLDWSIGSLILWVLKIVLHSPARPGARLTPLTPVRVALRVPKRHGLFATWDTAWSRLVRLGSRLSSPLGFDVGDPGRGWESSLTSEEGVRDGENATGWLEGEPVARVDCVDGE